MTSPTLTIDPYKAGTHLGHRLTVATYGTPPVNLAVECEDCYEVLGDVDIGVGIAQAVRHGHPEWSHLMAYGPCTRTD